MITPPYSPQGPRHRESLVNLADFARAAIVVAELPTVDSVLTQAPTAAAQIAELEGQPPR